MLSIDKKTVFQRISRVIDIFPNYRYSFAFDWVEPIEFLNHEKGYFLDDVWYIRYCPNTGNIHNIPKVIYNEAIRYPIEQQLIKLNDYEFAFIKIVEGPGENCWKDISIDNPQIPELQIRILDAIFGPGWENYITIKYLMPVNIIVNRKTKL